MLHVHRPCLHGSLPCITVVVAAVKRARLSWRSQPPVHAGSSQASTHGSHGDHSQPGLLSTSSRWRQLLDPWYRCCRGTLGRGSLAPVGASGGSQCGGARPASARGVVVRSFLPQKMCSQCTLESAFLPNSAFLILPFLPNSALTLHLSRKHFESAFTFCNKRYLLMAKKQLI